MNKILEELKKKRDEQKKKMKESGHDFVKIRAAYKDLKEIYLKMHESVCYRAIEDVIDDKEDDVYEFKSNTIAIRLYNRYEIILKMDDRLKEIDERITAVEEIIKETSAVVSKYGDIIF